MAEAAATPQEQRAWYDVLGKFRDAVARFDQVMARLRAQQSVAARHPQLSAEYNALMRAAAATQARIVYVRNASANVLNWIKGVFGFSGLGFVPLIPLAVVAAAVAAIAKITSDAWTLSKKLDQVTQLQAQGVSPARAVELATKTAGGGSLLSFNLGGFAPWLLIGGVVLLFAPQILNALKKGR